MTLLDSLWGIQQSELTLRTRFPARSESLEQLGIGLAHFGGFAWATWLLASEPAAVWVERLGPNGEPLGEHRLEQPAEPRVQHLSYASPLLVDLLVHAPAGVLAFWCLSRPRDIGAWLPRMVDGWRAEWDRSDLDQKNRRLRRAVTQTLLEGGSDQQNLRRPEDLAPDAVSMVVETIIRQLADAERHLGQPEVTIPELGDAVPENPLVNPRNHSG